MKKTFLIILIFILSISLGCFDLSDPSDEDNKFLFINYIETDYGGSAIYFLNNKTDYDLIIEYTSVSQLDGTIEKSDIIYSGDIKEFYYDFIIGINPRPNDTLLSLSILKADNLSVTIYSQDPINIDSWIQEDMYNVDEYDYGLIHWILDINNQDLNFK